MVDSDPELRPAVERTLRLGQIRAFNAIVLHGSFSDAARALGVSQPAVTMQVRALEEAAGGRLFVRGQPAELTPLGAGLLGDLRTLGHLVDTVEARLAASRDLVGGTLSLGLCGPFVGMPLLGAFLQRHPGVKVNTHLANASHLLEAVQSQRMDLAIVTLPTPTPDLFNLLLATQRVVVAAPAGHPLANVGRIRLERLAAERLITREPGSMTREVFETGLGRAGWSIAPVLELGSREAVKEAVACGLGLGIVLDREFGADRRLAMLAIEDAALTAGEYLVCPPALAGVGAVAAFVALAREGLPGAAAA
jgi:LysR family transcriptional regulator, low CO2-responsive transcriptional regulator